MYTAMARWQYAIMVFLTCILLRGMADPEIDVLEHRVKACKFISEKMEQRGTSSTSTSSASGSQSWEHQSMTASSLNSANSEYYTMPSVRESHHETPPRTDARPNLAVLYGGELLRNLRQLFTAAASFGMEQQDERHDEEPTQRSRTLKRMTSMAKTARNKFAKTITPQTHVEKLLYKQDKCLQELATKGYLAGNELVFTLFIEKKRFDEFKNIVAHCGGFIDRIIYYPDFDVDKQHNNFFEQMFYAIMELKNTVYQNENQYPNGMTVVMQMGPNGMVPMGTNGGMMMAPAMNNSNNNGVPVMANYGAQVGTLLDNWLGTVVEYGKKKMAAYQSSAMPPPPPPTAAAAMGMVPMGMAPAVPMGMADNNNNDNGGFGPQGISPDMYNMVMTVIHQDFGSTTRWTHQTRSQLVDDIGIALQGMDQWPREWLVKLLYEDFFEGMRYIKARSQTTASYWEAVLNLSPVRKGILQFCKWPSASGPGLKFRSRTKKEPNNFIGRYFNKFKSTWKSVIKGTICF